MTYEMKKKQRLMDDDRYIKPLADSVFARIARFSLKVCLAIVRYLLGICKSQVNFPVEDHRCCHSITAS